MQPCSRIKQALKLKSLLQLYTLYCRRSSIHARPSKYRRSCRSCVELREQRRNNPHPSWRHPYVLVSTGVEYKVRHFFLFHATSCPWSIALTYSPACLNLRRRRCFRPTSGVHPVSSYIFTYLLTYLLTRTRVPNLLSARKFAGIRRCLYIFRPLFLSQIPCSDFRASVYSN
jgi:hypothetical protein